MLLMIMSIIDIRPKINQMVCLTQEKNWDYISLSLNAAQELISRKGVSKNDGATMEKVLTQGWQSYDQLTHDNGNRAFNTEAEYKK